jgi:hypothetical protein
MRVLASPPVCASCHPKETAGFLKSGMARSLAPATNIPDGSFTHTPSSTRFTVRSTSDGIWQSLEHGNETEALTAAYAIGSGNHAIGYLVEIDHHLFQSPLSYYTVRKLWDVAPGYEQSSAPDFSRPVTPECLACHSDQPRPAPNTLNTFQSPPFGAMAISCDRCHGSSEAHLKKPVPGSILNPAKLNGAARDSICEQCHLAGEIRIPNPGRTLADFHPGERTEDVFTVYVATGINPRGLKVISHSEQLALSTCARQSDGKLWCGTCHDPHEKPLQPAAYYRERCLSCHASTLSDAHAAPKQDCVACHMPRLPARDGGHTVFTDHRIARHPEIPPPPTPGAPGLRAWREPEPTLRERNLALALVTHGLENSLSDEAIRGYRMLNRMEPQLSNDAAALTALGSVLLTAKQPREAEIRFERALTRRPDYAPYEVNLGNALLEAGETTGALRHLERAAALDPLLQQAVYSLARAYRRQGDAAHAASVVDRYRAAMNITMKTK